MVICAACSPAEDLAQDSRADGIRRHVESGGEVYLEDFGDFAHNRLRIVAVRVHSDGFALARFGHPRPRASERRETAAIHAGRQPVIVGLNAARHAGESRQRGLAGRALRGRFRGRARHRRTTIPMLSPVRRVEEHFGAVVGTPNRRPAARSSGNPVGNFRLVQLYGCSTYMMILPRETRRA